MATTYTYSYKSTEQVWIFCFNGSGRYSVVTLRLKDATLSLKGSISADMPLPIL